MSYELEKLKDSYTELSVKYQDEKEKADKYFHDYLDKCKELSEYKDIAKKGSSNFKFLFFFAFLSAMLSVIYLNPYLNFAAVVWRGAIITIITSFIGLALKYIHETTNPEKQLVVYVGCFILATVLVWLIQNRLIMRG